MESIGLFGDIHQTDLGHVLDRVIVFYKNKRLYYFFLDVIRCYYFY